MLLNLKSVERKKKNYEDLNISRTKRAFWMKEKVFLIVLEGLSLGERIKDMAKRKITKIDLIEIKSAYQLQFR